MIDCKILAYIQHHFRIFTLVNFGKAGKGWKLESKRDKQNFPIPFSFSDV